MAENTAVSYTGSSTRRLVTREQWKAAGVDGQATVEWSAANDFEVPRDKLNEDALKVLAKDKAFKIPNVEPTPDAVDVDTQDAKPVVVDEEAPKPEGRTTTRR
jgi:hypothetical protein